MLHGGRRLGFLMGSMLLHLQCEFLLMRRAHKKVTPALTAIDLFSGCGGLSVGLQKAAFRACAAVEIDAKAQATYRLNHSETKLYGEDIRQLNAKTLLKNVGLKVGQLDLLAGCPPCQGFSSLRTRNKTKSIYDPRNNLINDFFANFFRPRI